MAVQLAVGDILRLRVVCTCRGQNGINILHLKVTAITGTSASDVTAVGAIDTALGPIYKPLLSTTAVYRGVGLTRLSPAPQTQEVTSIANTGIGTGGANLVPGNVAGLITLRTDNAGRKYRGRLYTPFPSPASVAALGDPTGVYITALGVLANWLQNNIVVGTAPNQATLRVVIADAKVTRNTLVTVASGSVWFWSQRRREFGRRPDLVPF